MKVAPDVEIGAKYAASGEGEADIHKGDSKAIVDHYKSVGLTITLPTNTFSMAAFFPALFPFEDDEDKCRWVRILIISLGQYWVTMAISIIYIIYIEDLWKAEEIKIKNGVCTETDALLMYTSLFVFTVAVFVDVRETIDIVRYVKNIPVQEGWFATLGFHKRNNELHFVEGDGLSRPHKIAVYLGVTLPKFVIAIFLLVLGSWWIIASTSNTFVFLHTMSLTFVLRVDNIMYEILNSRTHQILLKALPKIKIARPNRRQKCLAHYMGIMILIVVPLIVLALMMSAEAQKMPKCKDSRRVSR
mmetsp:Transcript_110909/g.196510  ORF Transcript_110909/g.196510 Transcript_110909/m.196510 type:complete len:302 (-) Transcript_110909:66-971(-)